MQLEASRSSSARHALTAPAVRPNAIFRWTSEEEDHDGNRSQRRRGHQPAPVRRAARPVEVREPYGQRLVRLIREDDVGEDVLVPARDEHEHRRGHETWSDERKQDAGKGSETARAVHHRRLLELLRDPHDEAAKRPDGERQQDDEVRQDDPHERVRQVVLREHDVQRDDEAGLRQHEDPDDEDDEELVAREAVLGKGDGGEERHDHRERDDSADDDQAVLDRVPEVRSVRSRHGSAEASDRTENQVGVKLMISVSGLNAVEIIHKTGNTRTRKTRRPTTFHATRRSRRWRSRRRHRLTRSDGRLDGDSVALTEPRPSSPSAGRRRCSTPRRSAASGARSQHRARSRSGRSPR